MNSATAAANSVPPPLAAVRKVGAAITMQPHADALIAEAARFAERLNATLTLIHTGASHSEKFAFLDEIAQRLPIPHEAHVIEAASDPANELLRNAESAQIDLLVAGAFEGSALKRRRFLSLRARQLAERSRCSLLLVAHPRLDAHDFRRIVVITDFSDSARLTCEQALWLAEKDAAELVTVISIHTPFMQARAKFGDRKEVARTREEEELLLEEFVRGLPCCSRPVDWRVIDAGTGFAACDFADAIAADLLVLPGRDHLGGRVLPMADWVLQVVPCSLWIIHERPAWKSAEK